jgi:hypothetical protein
MRAVFVVRGRPNTVVEISSILIKGAEVENLLIVNGGQVNFNSGFINDSKIG